MQVTCCQLDIAWENKEANFAKVNALLANARVEPDGLIVLPEMFATGFSMNPDRVCETAGAETHRFLSDLARRTRSYVVGGLPGRCNAGAARNFALAYNPNGELISSYIKRQPFTAGGEDKQYSAGDTVALFDCGGFKAASFVCYDLRFPELFREAAMAGAELFIVIANWPYKRIDHWTTLLKARAIENQAYVIGVNRAGRDPDYIYCGRSMIVDPHGNVLGELHDTEALVQSHIDPATVRQWRSDFPALRDYTKK